jgi:hypothetical protein
VFNFATLFKKITFLKKKKKKKKREKGKFHEAKLANKGYIPR